MGNELKIPSFGHEVRILGIACHWNSGGKATIRRIYGSRIDYGLNLLSSCLYIVDYLWALIYLSN